MKVKKSILLVLVFISSLMSEEFIDTLKELSDFSSQYDFGAPFIKKRHVTENETEKKNESIKESNISSVVIEPTVESPAQKLKKELSLKCGAKCGIDFKSIPAQ